MNKNNSTAIDCDEDSFVHVMDTEEATPAASSDGQKADALNLTVTPRHGVVGVENNMCTTQVCATIRAIDIPDDESKRAPVDIVVALDLSASMSGSKLHLCKTTLELLIRQLLPHDRFGLVTFSDHADIEIPTMKLNEKNKAMALSKVKTLRTRGCTNISAAIGMAAQELRSIENPNSVRSVFLLTDGHANRGVSDASGIVDIAKGCFTDAMDDGSSPTIHCFGYGSDHDESLLTAVSEVTPGGAYYFVENDSNVSTAFGDALGGILSVVAQNAVLNIGVCAGAVDLGVEIGELYHESAIKRDGGSFTITVGDFYAEESRDVLFDVTLAALQSGMESSNPIAHVNAYLSYTDTLAKRPVLGRRVECCIARPTGKEVSQPDPHVVAQWLRIHCTHEIDSADQLSSSGNLSTARTKIQQCKELIASQQKNSDVLKFDPLVDQLAKDLDMVLSGLSSESYYHTFGSKQCKRTRQTHTMQRSNDSTFDPNAYRSSRKRAMVSTFNTLDIGEPGST